jgi:hypothetical protein
VERQEDNEERDEELEEAFEGLNPVHAFPPRREDGGTAPLRGDVCA